MIGLWVFEWLAWFLNQYYLGHNSLHKYVFQSYDCIEYIGEEYWEFLRTSLSIYEVIRFSLRAFLLRSLEIIVEISCGVNGLKSFWLAGRVSGTTLQVISFCWNVSSRFQARISALFRSFLVQILLRFRSEGV